MTVPPLPSLKALVEGHGIEQVVRGLAQHCQDMANASTTLPERAYWLRRSYKLIDSIRPTGYVPAPENTNDKSIPR